jgi:hypothetical protein
MTDYFGRITVTSGQSISIGHRTADHIEVNAATAGVTITIDANMLEGRTILFERLDNSSFPVFITCASGQTISGQSVFNLLGKDSALKIFCTTGRFVIIGSYNLLTFLSGEFDIVHGGNVQINHGLTAIPASIGMKLICKVAEAGYEIGDELVFGSGSLNNQLSQGFSITANNMKINLRFGNSVVGVFTVMNKLTGQSATLTNANWKIRLFTRA